MGRPTPATNLDPPFSIDYSVCVLDNLESDLATAIDVAPTAPDLMSFLDDIDFANRPVNINAIPVPQLMLEELHWAILVVSEDY